jgi:alpha-ribazole phosphatase
MSETRFWLIRHAMVDENSRAMLYGVMDVPLCETTLAAQGRMYEALARRLPRPAVWKVTPLSRTQRTAKAIFAAGYPTQSPEVEADFIEQSLGEWQGLPHAELPARLLYSPHPFWPLSGDEKPPGGESMHEVMQRTGAALERLATGHEDEDVVIVSHGGTIRAAVAYALDIHPNNALHLSIFNLSLTCLERHPEGWRVTRVNELPGY